METTLTKKRATFNPVLNMQKQSAVTLTYEIIQQQKRQQQYLIDAGIIEKPKLKEGFTAEDWLDMQTAISIEEYAAKRKIAI